MEDSMKKKLMAYLLLAGVVLTMPVYADDRTPDEYNPDAKYESPSDQANSRIVNDYRTIQANDEGEAFVRNAGKLMQGNVSAKETADPQSVAEAKTKRKVEEAKTERQAVLPIIITGDDAQYENDSGDFTIEGNVTLQQGETHLFSSKAVGNAKSGDVWLLEGGTLKETANTVQANWAHYNFNSKTGELRSIKGESKPDVTGDKKDYYTAPHGIINNGALEIDQGGTYTRCPAVKHEPCLLVKAKTITIVPNERIVAKDVQVFLKGKLIYKRKVWTQTVGEENNRVMPRLGWKSNKGFYVSLDYEQPIGNPLVKNPTKAYMHQVYYTNSKYKPFYGIRHDEPDFYVRLHDGYVYDSDNDFIDEGIWLHKKTDWGLFLKPHRIARGIPLSYEAGITRGLWKYTNENWSSWHTEKFVSLRHDRIYLFGGEKLYLDLMAGRKWVDESVAGTADTVKYGKKLNTNIYHGTIGYRFSKKWNIWETYHNEHKTSYNFTLGQPDFSREWITGVSWKPDDRNLVIVVNRYNSDSGSPTHGNYSTRFIWQHRFCCEFLSVEYERKHYKHDNDWTVKFDIVNW